MVDLSGKTCALVQLDGGQVSGEYTAHTIRMISYMLINHPGVFRAHQRWVGGPIVATGRNSLVKWFLRTDIDYMLTIDSDMTFDATLMEQMLASADADHPIIAGHCYALLPDKGPIATMWTRDGNGSLVQFEHYPEDGLVEVAATGAACLLIHRSVLEDLRDFQEDHAQPWFEEVYYGGRPMGEDLAFCLRATARGHKIFVDTRLDVGHIKEVKVDRQFFKDWRRVRRFLVTGSDSDGLRWVARTLTRVGCLCTFEKVYTKDGREPWGDRWGEATTRYYEDGDLYEEFEGETIDIDGYDIGIDLIREILQLARFPGMLRDDEIQEALDALEPEEE